MKHPLRKIAETGLRPVNRQANHGIAFAWHGFHLQIAKVKQRFRDEAQQQVAHRQKARRIEHSGHGSMLWADLKRKLTNRVKELSQTALKRTGARERTRLYSEFDDLLATCSAKLPHRFTTFCWMLTRRMRRLGRLTPKPRDVTDFIERLPQLYHQYGVDSILLMRETAKVTRRRQSTRR